jgi:putative sigma-54 modulation protein
MKVDIRSIHFTADQKLLGRIESKLQRLQKFYSRIIDANVTLKLENSGQIRDKIMELKVRVPGDLLVVTSTSKTFEGALESAVRTLKRRLVRLKERQQQR